jgi:hypothetical protein
MERKPITLDTPDELPTAIGDIYGDIGVEIIGAETATELYFQHSKSKSGKGLKGLLCGEKDALSVGIAIPTLVPSAEALDDALDDALDATKWKEIQSLQQVHDVLALADTVGWRREKVAYSVVLALLSDLVAGFSKPNFQRELQKLLIDARMLRKQNGGVRKIVPGRCALCQAVEDKAMAAAGYPKAIAWQVIAAFSHEEKVLRQLSVLDELLALPPNSYFNAVLEAGRNHSSS